MTELAKAYTEISKNDNINEHSLNNDYKYNKIADDLDLKDKYIRLIFIRSMISLDRIKLYKKEIDIKNEALNEIYKIAQEN